MIDGSDPVKPSSPVKIKLFQVHRFVILVVTEKQEVKQPPTRRAAGFQVRGFCLQHFWSLISVEEVGRQQDEGDKRV